MNLIIPLLAIAVVILFLSVRVLKEYERGVLFTLGRLSGERGPGLILLLPVIQKMNIVDQRTVTMDVPPQDIITKDNVSIKVNAVIYFRVLEPVKAITQVENFLYATSQLSQTTLRSVCGEAELDDLLSQREQINTRVQSIIDHQTAPWGIKVLTVEVKDIDLPQEMQRAMAKQAEAERERRARIIQAEGEFQAAEKLTAAAKIMSGDPATIQLRYLDTLRHIAGENNSTILFPIPIELFKAFGGKDK